MSSDPQLVFYFLENTAGILRLGQHGIPWNPSLSWHEELVLSFTYLFLLRGSGVMPP